MSPRAKTRTPAQKRKRLLLAAILTLTFLLAILMAWVLGANRNDPVYQGRRLSAWLQNYPHTPPQPMEAPREGMQPFSSEQTEHFYRTHFGKEVAQAHRALLAVGGDALPLLVQMLGERQKPLTVWWSRVQRTIARYIPVGPGGYLVSREQAITALLDLHRGGCNLGPIMREIEKLSTDRDQEVSAAARFLAPRCLCGMAG